MNAKELLEMPGPTGKAEERLRISIDEWLSMLMNDWEC
jgi:hypothetical protein